MRLHTLIMLFICVTVSLSDTLRQHRSSKSKSHPQLLHGHSTTNKSSHIIVRSASRPRKTTIIHRKPLSSVHHLPSKPSKRKSHGPVPPVVPSKRTRISQRAKKIGPPAMKPPRGLMEKLNKAPMNDFRRLAMLLLRRSKQ